MCFLFCFSCFISHANTVAFYISLLGPACCILIINTVVFTLVARVILKPKFRGHPNGGKRENVTPTQVRGAFTVMVLLGVTWVFGPVAIDESKLVFNYIFVVLNSLQGFLIFIFRCLINTEVRLCWLYLLKTGKFKRRRGPIKSTTESSSSKAFHDSKMNNCSTIDSTIDTNNPSNGRLSVTSGNGHENEFREYDKNKNKHDSFGLDNFKKTWGLWILILKQGIQYICLSVKCSRSTERESYTLQWWDALHHVTVWNMQATGIEKHITCIFPS